jgi:hypothetical protein
MSIHVFGIRHHGSGSARSLLHALVELAPDAILVEGPPDAQNIVTLAADEGMQPPVAMLVYAADEPQKAAYYPFAVFSPEWQAIRYGVSQNVPVRFMDMPLTMQFALEAQEPAEVMRTDPLGELAKAAGYEDSERWWEHLVEQRQNSSDVFEVILEAMTALREGEELPERHIDLLRDAHMRQTIRKAVKEGYQRIAVVCGAWHAPALIETQIADKQRSKQDDALLKGLKTIKTDATWLPWTHGRLTFASGYGAGIWSPGWYQHLWENTSDVSVKWLTRVAHLLREKDLDASPAQVIDTVRLADALAAMRGRSMPDLAELNDATRSVLCFGSDEPMRLIHDKLIVGEMMGDVPDTAPMVPLQRDLTQEQKRLRIKPEASVVSLELDLREPTHLQRSYLLHRLNLLGVQWGSKERARGKGTFREVWQLRWSPELTIQLIEKGVWGNTVYDAATAFARHNATNITELPDLTALMDHALQADLSHAVESLVKRLQELAALTGDVSLLMGSLPSLAEVLTYGNVRQTDASMVGVVVDGLVTRVCISLPMACSGIDDAAAAPLFELVVKFNAALRLLRNDEHLTLWRGALQRIVASPAAHGLLKGRACRILFDAGDLTQPEVATQMRLALSLADEPTQIAAWLQGFLQASGFILIHDHNLLVIIDEWVVALAEADFIALLPLIRRTFSTFASGERKQIGQLIKGNQQYRSDEPEPLDPTRAAAILPIFAQMLGVEYDN